MSAPRIAAAGLPPCRSGAAGSRPLRRWAASALVWAAAWGAAAPEGAAQERAVVGRMVDSLLIYVEGATGLTFLRAPRYGVRTRPELRAYLAERVDRQLSAERLRGATLAYHLLGLLPDTTAVRKSRLVQLYTAVLRGYYDAETDTLFVVAGEHPASLREVLSHEMVHALQDQYVDLATLVERLPDNDAKFAARAVVEGQATFASLRLITGGRNVVSYTGIWRELVRYMKLDPSLDPRFRRVPLLVREGIVGPYVYGAQFMSWWQGYELADSAPFGPRLPASTEQLLHPERYREGDRPVALRFTDSAGAVVHEDVVGELELHLLAAQLAGAKVLGAVEPIGWGGDRYRVYDTPAGPALVWYSVWDDPESAAAFRRGSAARLAARVRAGYHSQLDSLTTDGRSAVRYVFAPDAWDRWRNLPAVEVISERVANKPE